MKFFIILIISCIYLIDSVNSKSKYYDGPDRAYKFGYSIEGNQHRQETKDENGIIMGEFGFITADGVYHVTGYGTDENGNFKILYMKNIKIGLPGEPGQQPAPKNIGGSVPQQSAPVQKQPISAPAPVQKQPGTQIKTSIASDTPSCGSCIIPVIEKEVNKAVKQTVSSGANAVAQAPRTPSGGSLGGGLAAVGGGGAPGAGPGSRVGGAGSGASASGSGAGRTPGASGASAQKLPAQSLAGGAAGGRAAVGAQGRQGKGLRFPESSDPTSLSAGNAQDPNIDARILSNQNGGSPSSPSSLTNAGAPSRVGASLPLGAGSPSRAGSPSGALQPPGSSSSAGRGNSNNPNTFASDPSGLTIASGSPSGSSSSSQGGDSGSKRPLDLTQMQNIINGILYKFNYTVGYHGHHEEGDHIGNKDGGYYSIGRDGLHRSVDYTANENGFQPHIKLRPVNDPNEIPKPETEKEAGLKGYEFKWFNLGDGNHNSKRQ